MEDRIKCQVCNARKAERYFSRARRRLSPYGFRPECNDCLDERDLNPFAGMWRL